jgi:hypothetical protein
MLFTKETEMITMEESKFHHHLSMMLTKLVNMNQLELRSVGVIKDVPKEYTTLFHFPGFQILKTISDDLVVSTNDEVSLVFLPKKKKIMFAAIEKDEAELLLNHLMTITI